MIRERSEISQELKEDNVPLPLLIWIIANDSRKKLNIKSEKILQSLHEIDKPKRYYVGRSLDRI